MQKNIQNKKLEPQETKTEVIRDFFFPACGITIRAGSLEEANELLNKELNNK